MAKVSGRIGYVTSVETRPGVYMERATERSYHGDLLQNQRKFRDGSSVNGSIDVANRISIVRDPYARDHFHEIRYVTFQNSKWTVTEAVVGYPRITLTLGGLYNGTTQN